MLISQILLFVIPCSSVFDLVSKCRSAVIIIQKYSRFKFAFIIMSPVALLLSAWIHRTIPVPKDFGYYFATSDASTIQGYGEAFGIELALQVQLFVLFSVVLFLLFRLALSNLLSCFAVVMFMTNAQVVLVYLSAPFWDFSTAVIPLVAIIGTIVLLSSQHQNFSLIRKTRRKFVVTIICSNLVILILYHRVYNLRAQQRISIFASAIVVLVVGLIWLRSERNEAESENQTVLRTSGWDRLFFVPILFTLFLLQPILGRGGKSYATMILGVCLFVFVLSESRLRTSYKFVLPTLFLLLVQLRSSGDYFQFYSFTGWTGATQLVSGRAQSIHSFGIPFTDSAIWQLTEINKGQALYLQNLAINSSTIVKNLEIGWTYLFNGFWKFSEPPLGFDYGALSQVRKRLTTTVSLVTPLLFTSAVIFCFQKSRRVALFVSLIMAVLLFSISFTRPQMHQWWMLQIFGLYGALFAMSWLSKTIASVVFSQKSSIRSKSKVIHCKQQILSIDSKILKKLWVQFLFLLFIFAISPKIVFNVLNYVSEKLENDSLDVLATEYGRQDWAPIPVNNGATRNIALHRESNLIKVEVSNKCTLSGVRVHYLNSDASDDVGLDTGEFYRTKFHIANTNSQIVYIPFFPRNIVEPAISVVGLKADCSLRVYQASLKEQALPLVALLVPNREAIQLEISAEESSTTNGGEEMLLDPLSFEGYIKNSGYQAVGDEFSHQWLNDQIGDRILGRSKQGYQVVDIWSQKINIETDGMRVLVRGRVKRGIVIIGWAKSDPAARNVTPDEFSYAVRGSIFDTATRSLYQCFELPAAKEIQNGSKVELFVGSVFDLYSPRWTSYEIDSIILDKGTCDSNRQPISFLPTL